MTSGSFLISPYHVRVHRAIFAVILFAATFAWVEASVVVYLRDLYYPDGFFFPLKPINTDRLWIELIRELSTIVMLATVGFLAGATRWQRFAYFSIAFGVWDIFFYLWLKMMIDWPASVIDWDILFLLPLPWIGPVIAPVLVSVLLILGGAVILRTEQTCQFRPGGWSWITALFGSFVILGTFMADTAAGLQGTLPQPYHYTAFFVGVGSIAVAIVLGRNHSRSQVLKATQD